MPESLQDGISPQAADGEYRWIIESGIPRYSGGEFAGYIGSNIDITDLKRAEQERERLRQA
jgi:PAS domain S-box-containing protein